MKEVFRFAARAALAMLLMCLISLFFVEFKTAEWYILIFSIIMMTVMFLSAVILQKKYDKQSVQK